MKKYLLTTALLLSVASGAFAQTLLDEGFETGNTGSALTPVAAGEGWTVVNGYNGTKATYNWHNYYASPEGESGGTITGVGETVKAWTNDIRIVAVEPYESQALSSGLTGSHGIPDIGFGLVPGNYNSYVVDNIAAVTTADAVRAAQRVLRTDAIPASPSAGAALHAAAQLIANGKSRSALAVFSARQNIL